MKHVSSAVVVLSLSLLAASCAGTAPSCDNVHWSYEGSTGPDHWADIAPPCFAECRDGREQSPTDLSRTVFDPGLPQLEPSYASDATVEVVNNGHTIKAYVPAGSKLTIGSNEFELEEFHFHTRSEHRLPDGQPGLGRQTPLEMHLVHKGPGGTAAVGVFIVEDPQDRENPELAKIWRNLEGYGPGRTPVSDVDIMALLPSRRSSFRYAGSLTTPACGQGLQWSVLVTPITASKEQIARFARLFAPAGNSRPLQPLNGRTVKRDFQ